MLFPLFFRIDSRKLTRLSYTVQKIPLTLIKFFLLIASTLVISKYTSDNAIYWQRDHCPIPQKLWALTTSDALVNLTLKPGVVGKWSWSGYWIFWKISIIFLYQVKEYLKCGEIKSFFSVWILKTNKDLDFGPSSFRNSG